MLDPSHPGTRVSIYLSQGEDCEVEDVLVPPACYNGSLPKRRGSMYYCETHALRESECSVRE